MILALIFVGIAAAAAVWHAARHRRPRISLEDRLRHYHVHGSRVR